MTRRRLDAELVRRGIVGSRTEAQDAIRDGLVRVAGATAVKPSTLVSVEDPLQIVGAPRRFVSRGGAKLDAAIERFGVEVFGRECLDLGASTGGFTDRLLQAGASRVVAVDVGYGQLAWSIRTDPRVVVLERTNARTLQPSDLPMPPSLVVGDLSFISLTLVVPAIARIAAPAADVVLLVKPQFEVGRRDVGSGGVVRDPDGWRRAIERVSGALTQAGFRPVAVMPSPIRGPAGNVEFLLHARRGRESGSAPDVDRAIREATGDAS